MNAQEKYDERKLNIQKQLDRINELLKDHAFEQSQYPDIWAYSGDLGHVEETLLYIIKFLK